jgi:hypothetical protein
MQRFALSGKQLISCFHPSRIYTFNLFILYVYLPYPLSCNPSPNLSFSRSIIIHLHFHSLIPSFHSLMLNSLGRYCWNACIIITSESMYICYQVLNTDHLNFNTIAITTTVRAKQGFNEFPVQHNHIYTYTDTHARTDTHTNIGTYTHIWRFKK